jgi:hypothetical protein
MAAWIAVRHGRVRVHDLAACARFQPPGDQFWPVGYNAPNQELAASNQQRRILIVAA